MNNAAAARGADRVPVIDLDIDLWRTVIDVNLNGTFYMSRAFGRHRQHGTAAIRQHLPLTPGKMIVGQHGRVRSPQASTP